MGDIPKFSELTGNETLQELIDRVAQLQKMINWWGAGNVSSVNAREFGGWLVGLTALQARAGDVGLSTANDGDDPVRLWAGSVDKDTAPWRVYKSGKMVATGALIQSKDGTYPYVAMDPTGDLFGAYASPTQSIVIGAYGNSHAPYLEFTEGADSVSIDLSFSNFTIASSAPVGITSNTDIDITAKRDLFLYTQSGYVRTVSWSRFLSDSDGTSLAEELDLKATAGSSTGSAGSHNHGITPGRYLKTYNSSGAELGLQLWVQASDHIHMQV